jgi:hypothetical protein
MNTTRIAGAALAALLTTTAGAGFFAALAANPAPAAAATMDRTDHRDARRWGWNGNHYGWWDGRNRWHQGSYADWRAHHDRDDHHHPDPLWHITIRL